jgi:plastocyanin domain-containing protein
MDVVLVNLAGLALIGLIVWYFWLSKPAGAAAGISSGGIQEAFIVVKDGYSPDTIRVTAGRPVRLVFNRQESDPCSERVILDAFERAPRVHPNGTRQLRVRLPVCLRRIATGQQMGMLRGTVVVT